jgi:hypothetical protein
MELVHDGVLDRPTLVRRCSHAVADLFQIRDRGYLREGYWADLVLVADQDHAVDADPILGRCGWTPFAGRHFRSRVLTTLVSGQIAWHDGRLNPACRGEALHSTAETHHARTLPRFLFEAAHTLQRDIGTEGSRRIHGHSYRATITLAGAPDPVTGMLIDIGHLDALLADTRDALDHRFLDEVPGLGPATLENLCSFPVGPARPQPAAASPGHGQSRPSGDACSFVGKATADASPHPYPDGLHRRGLLSMGAAALLTSAPAAG